MIDKVEMQKFSLIPLPDFDESDYSSVKFYFDHAEGKGHLWTDNEFIRVVKIFDEGHINAFRVSGEDSEKWIEELEAGKGNILPTTLGFCELKIEDSILLTTKDFSLTFDKDQFKFFAKQFESCAIWAKTFSPTYFSKTFLKKRMNSKETITFSFDDIEKIRRDILLVQAVEPELAYQGFKLWADVADDEKENQLKVERELMLDKWDEFYRACMWFARKEKAKSFNTSECSYQMKCLAEYGRSNIPDFEPNVSGYIPNGMFIAAAIHMGFRIKRVNPKNYEGSCYFNITKRSLKKAWMDQ